MARILAIVAMILMLAGLLGYGLARRAARVDPADAGVVNVRPAPAAAAPKPAPAVVASPFRFRDAADQAGLTTRVENNARGQFRLIETMGTGLALIDVDADGWLDLVMGQGGALPGDAAQAAARTALYRNNRDGTFTDITDESGLDFRGFSQGMAVGDYDGDGHPDLFLAGFERSALFRNNGRGGLVDVTDQAGVAGRGWPTSCAFADLDGDGDLDLYVVHYLADTVDARGEPTVRCDALEGKRGYCPPQAHRPEADVLYRNNGDGTFTDVSESAGLTRAAAPGLGLVIADFDADGMLDLFVANDQAPNQVWRNLGDLRFEEVAHGWGVALGENGETRAGMGVAAADHDGDGLLDLVVTNFYEEPVTLYRQVTPGLFQVTTAQARLAVPSRSVLGFGTGFLDADNDGLLDLFVTNGHINDVRRLGIPYAQPAQLFRNEGGGRFEDVSTGSGAYFEGAWLGRAAALGDLDNDGDMDILVSHLERNLALLLNETQPRGRFIMLELESATRSRSPIGAVVTARVGGRAITRHVVGGTSYLASHDPRVLIGVGEVDNVDELQIQWPSGRVETHRKVATDTWYRVREGEPPAAVRHRATDGTE